MIDAGTVEQPAGGEHRARSLWWTVFLVALGTRAVWGVYRIATIPESSALEFPDEQQYWLMADSLRSGHGLRDELGFRATRMPLYPAMLSLFAAADHGVVAAKVLHWLIGAAAAGLTSMAAASMLGRRVGWIAGLLVAFDPFLIFFSSLLLTESPFLVALVLLLWVVWPLVGGDPGGHGGVAARWTRWIAVGAAAALCVYVRESSLGLVFILLGYVSAVARFDRTTMAGAVLAAAVVVVSLVPWAVRNRRVTGDWCWLTHRGGISLYDGVGPQATGRSNLGKIKRMPAVCNLNEVEWDAYFLDESFRLIKADPARIVRLAGYKLARMWNPFPNVDTYRSRAVRMVSAAWMLPLFVLAFTGAIAWPKRDWWPGWRTTGFLLLPVLYLTALHGLFIGSVRYRLGVHPMMAILAATTLAAAWEHIQQRYKKGDRTLGA